MRWISLGGLLACLGFAGALQGQEARGIEVGDRVRVRAPSIFAGWRTGEVARAAADSLVIRAEVEAEDEPARLAIGWDALERVQVPGRRPGARGALVGAGLGALAGASLALGGEAFADADQPDAPVYGAVAGAVLGGIMGGGGTSVARGAGIGLGIGALAGVAVGLVAGQTTSADLAAADAILMGAGLFGAIGFAIGTAAGFSDPPWTDIPLDRVRPVLTVGPAGIRVGVRVAG